MNTVIRREHIYTSFSGQDHVTQSDNTPPAYETERVACHACAPRANRKSRELPVWQTMTERITVGVHQTKP